LLTFDEGSLSFDLNVVGENVRSFVKAVDIPIEYFHPFLPSLAIIGKTSMEASLGGTFANPIADLSLEFDNVKIQDPAFARVPPLKGIFTVALSPDDVKLAGKVIGIPESPVEIDANIPLKLSLSPMSFSWKKESPIAMNILASTDIAPLLHLFSTDTTNITGKAKIALNVSGTIETPNIQGQAELIDGTFEDHETGAIFTHIHANLEGDGSKVLLKELSGMDATRGQLSGSGVIEIDLAKKFPYEIDLIFDKTQFVRLDFAKAVGSGSLKLTGTTEGGLVKGKINSDEIIITIPEQNAALMESVEITYINQPVIEKGPTQISPPKTSFPLNLDVEMDVANNAKISDENLTSEWKGNIKMTGTTTQPIINGEFKILQGQYMFNGKAFKITQGTIAFNGPPEKTTLYIITAYDLNAIVAEVILKGPIKNPSISFRSNPPLSQREILSYILFGRGFSELSPVEGSQISHSIKNLNTKSQTPDVLSKIKNTIGIDRIDISRNGGSEANDVSVQVGKYISRGVFVYVNRSITAGSNRLAIEAEVMHNIKLQAEVGDGEDSDSSVLFKWKHDY
jgi:translocation and assembly module TamB